ncbi:MAG: SET domain-containing protein-lysine N-methyltransferase [Acidobacteriota bacterium]|nr:SET domain-containing protein-lysine N-methyltransferase [Acidobacteriota bacterium]
MPRSLSTKVREKKDVPQPKARSRKSSATAAPAAGVSAIDAPAIDKRYAGFKLSVRPSKIHRWGVYAEENIPARRKVMEYTGERISRRETKRRSERGGSMVYLFTLDDYWTLDGSVGGSGAEYINHCCDPNIVTVIRGGHILYMSRRPIRKGEELTVDYHFAKDIEKYVCKCGAAACRGTINLK